MRSTNKIESNDQTRKASNGAVVTTQMVDAKIVIIMRIVNKNVM